ncbi:nuclear transport factor 2 family protein [Nannocystis bainbridge]|uniref:Nuclear transport factor 2 family protein n=1 Tax=Nannocystis bainbridge TaxID=2995303 RepID=A0ABT5E721_9BACT|nr:nuclear transport factor 2 family protein [Nannocystis bainbridge]MDC0721664.1 nuclear transport factor 2 family protein [Nannocystis bainbridge]
MDHRTFVDQMFARVDVRDAEGFAACFTERGSFQFANHPVVTGRAAIQDFIAGFFAGIGGIRHQFENCWSLDDRAFCNGFVTYVRKDGSELTVPWATVSRFEDGKLAEYLAYVDASKLFAP